ncbi:TRAP transporter substrate-binding protein [Natronincola ferrireducens]|uniref:C4-dicarboxylate-binding protein DctP n=1 Tax=Natronincola ferrireducens TaxID=393762 RepID=A0A1G9G1H8_9FIRM|nr:TRAP transporter substrate-binding protein [Natronincola ferrireducens]SDK94500.1 C4-dicarboxylate-binding protein DctP [Natronincola ferrireducens]
MKRRISLILVFALVLTLAVGCGTSEPAGGQGGQEKIVIRLGHDLLEDTHQHYGALEFKKMVEEKTDGRIEVQVFPAGQLGTDIEIAEMMQSNAVEAGLVPTAKLSGFHAPLQLIDLPFLFPSREITYKLLDSELADDLFQPMEKIGLKGLAFWESGFKQFTANKEIRKPSDFEGLQIRVMESPLLIAQYRALGANPIPIDFSETYNALQQGVADGQENPLVSIAAMRFYEVQSHMTLSNHGYLAYALLFSNSFWDRLSPEDQEILQTAAREAGVLERQEAIRREEGFIETIESSGTTVIRLSDEEMAAFSEAMKPVHEEFADVIGRDLLQKAYDLIEEFQK